LDDFIASQIWSPRFYRNDMPRQIHCAAPSRADSDVDPATGARFGAGWSSVGLSKTVSGSVPDVDSPGGFAADVGCFPLAKAECVISGDVAIDTMSA
jgi:hypothetical protein